MIRYFEVSVDGFKDEHFYVWNQLQQLGKLVVLDIAKRDVQLG